MRRPDRRRISRQNLGAPQRDQRGPLVRVAPELRAILATHVSLQLIYRRGLRSPDDVERHRLVGVAAEASDLNISKSRINRTPRHLIACGSLANSLILRSAITALSCICRNTE